MMLRRSLFSSILGAVLLLVAYGGAPAAGQGFSLAGLRGGSLSEAELSRGRVVVVLWASWSPRGRNVAERVNALAQAAGSRATVLAVNYQEDQATVQGFVASNPFTVPVYLDTDGVLAKKFKLANLPGLLVMKDGVVAYQGRMPDDPERVVEESLK